MDHHWIDGSGTTYTITESDPEIARILLAQLWDADWSTLVQIPAPTDNY